MTITAQEIRSRLLDTRSFFNAKFQTNKGNSQESKEPIEFQTERYSLQEKAIAVIAERNLGPAEDIQKLSDTMDTTSCSRRTTG